MKPGTAALAWAAGAWLAALPVMAGTIFGSQHDFSITPRAKQEICQPCHVPHRAQGEVSAAPLWNHAFSRATYTLYFSSSLKATMQQPMGGSKLCLSCHDGTVAIDSYPAGNTGNTWISAANKLGTDLNVHHPSSFLYDGALAVRKGALFDPAVQQVTIGAVPSRQGYVKDVMLVGGNVECSSCHDVHNTYTQSSAKWQTTKLLKVSMNGSALCFVCHDF